MELAGRSGSLADVAEYRGPTILWVGQFMERKHVNSQDLVWRDWRVDARRRCELILPPMVRSGVEMARAAGDSAVARSLNVPKEDFAELNQRARITHI
jgi:hypothetical protein